MKHKFLLAIIFIFSLSKVFSQDLNPVINSQGKYGFVDDNNDTVIPCSYDFAEDFHNGLALVKSNVQHKLIDTSGVLRDLDEANATGEIRYDLGEGHSGLPLIVPVWECMYIDVNADTLLVVPYRDAKSFENGKAKVFRNDEYNYINKTGVLLSDWKEIPDDYRPIKYNEKYGYINKNGNLAIPYEFDYAKDFKDGFAQISNEKFWALINTNGEKISDWYDKIGDFNGEIAPVEKAGNFGFINKDGRFVGKWYQIVEPLDYGLYKVMQYQKFAVVNQSGEIVTQWYDKIYEFEGEYLKVQKGDKYAYLNSIGAMMIGWYDQIGELVNNTILVKNNGKFAYYNTKKQLTSEWFDTLYTYSEGYAVARKDDKFGFIDEYGNIVFDFQFTDAHSFNNGLAYVEKDNKVAYMNKQGNFPLGWNERVNYFSSEPPRGIIVVKIGSRYTFQNLKGKRHFAEKFEYAENFSEGLALIKKNKRQMLIDLSGNLQDLDFYEKNPSKTRCNWGNNHDGKPVRVEVWDCYYIDYDQQIIIPEKGFSDAKSFSGGKAKVFKGDKFNYINHQGELIDDWQEVPQDYHSVYKNGKFGYIDKNNSLVIDYKFDFAYDFENGIAKVRNGSRKDGKFFLINKTGTAISEQFDEIFEFDQNGIAKVRNNEKYAMINDKGKTVSDWYDKIWGFSENIAKVKKDDKFAFIDIDANLISEWFVDAGEFSNGFAKVKIDDKWGFINRKGELVIECLFQSAQNFANNLAKVKKDGKFTFISTDGKPITDWYNKIYNFSDEMAVVENDNLWGYININGTVVIPLQFQRAYAFSDGIAPVIKDGEMIKIDKKGEKVIEEE